MADGPPPLRASSSARVSAEGLLDDAALDTVDAEVMALIDHSVAAARSAAPPTAADLLTDVYVSY